MCPDAGRGQVLEPAPAAMWAVLRWHHRGGRGLVTQVDIVAKAKPRVVPDGREQVIASLEGGILRELKVREGEAGAAPARRWPCWTRPAWKRSRPKGV
jgi:hypothetical protein